MDAQTRLADLAISDTGFVFDPYTGASFSVNEAGLALLRALKEAPGGRRALVGLLEERFDVRGQDLERDIDEFVGSLRRFGLVPRDYQLETP